MKNSVQMMNETLNMNWSIKLPILYIESVDETRFEEHEGALKYLEEIVYKNIRGTRKTAMLDINSREITID